MAPKTVLRIAIQRTLVFAVDPISKSVTGGIIRAQPVKIISRNVSAGKRFVIVVTKKLVAVLSVRGKKGQHGVGY